MPTSQPTPEEIEAARTLVATADAAADAARKAGVGAIIWIDVTGY